MNIVQDNVSHVELRRREFEKALNSLVQIARLEGYTVDLETVQLSDIPRMGGYGQRITVHLGNELYRGAK